MIDVVVDIETLSNLSRGVVVSAAYTIIPWEYGKLIDLSEHSSWASLKDKYQLLATEKYFSEFSKSMITHEVIFNAKYQISQYGRDVSNDTVKWHKSLSYSQYYTSMSWAIKPQDSIHEFFSLLDEVRLMGDSEIRFWAWHHAYDFSILNTLFEDAEMYQRLFDFRICYDIPTLGIITPLNKYKHPHTAGIDSFIEAVTLSQALLSNNEFEGEDYLVEGVSIY